MVGSFACLGGVGPGGDKVVADGDAGDISYAQGNVAALIVATLPQTEAVEGNRYNYVYVGEEAVGEDFQGIFGGEVACHIGSSMIFGGVDEAREGACAIVVEVAAGALYGDFACEMLMDGVEGACVEHGARQLEAAGEA